MGQLKIEGMEYKNGEIKIFDDRLCLFSPKIITSLGNIYGEGSKALLIYLGKKMGRRLIETWEEHLRPENVDELMEVFLSMFNLQGWGYLELITMNSKNIDELNLIELKLTQNVASTDTTPKGHICDFIVGYLSGFGEFAMHGAVVEETACSILNPNEPECKFVIVRRPIEF